MKLSCSLEITYLPCPAKNPFADGEAINNL